MEKFKWPHKFSNGLTHGSSLRYNFVYCTLYYELSNGSQGGDPINIRLLPKGMDDIGKGHGIALPISEHELLTSDKIQLPGQHAKYYRNEQD